MSVIAPAVLSDTPEDYRMQIKKIHEFVTRAHIDISDGEFAPSFTIKPTQLWWPQEWIVDIHAMVARPSDHLETLISLKPHMVIFHVEVEENIIPVLQHLKKFNIKAGIALMRSTVPSTVAAAIAEADHVMIFSGELGHYGGTASLMQLEKVRLIQAINPKAEIGWDGGVKVENAYTLSHGGIDVVNVGKSIAGSDNAKGVYDKLVSEINKSGII